MVIIENAYLSCMQGIHAFLNKLIDESNEHVTSLTHLCLSFYLCVDAMQLFSHVKGSSNNIHSIEQPREQRKALTYSIHKSSVGLSVIQDSQG